MNILFLGDIVGNSGCNAIKTFLPNIIKSKKINFVVANGENAAKEGVGITENIVNELISCGIDVITTGNHVWDKKETFEFIKNQKRLLRPLNLSNDAPGEGFGIFHSTDGHKVGVLNLMGNVFMKKCEDVFQFANKFILENKLKKNYDLSVFTSKNRRRTLKILNKYKLFKCIITADDVKKGKPNPEGLKKIISYFKTNRKNCTYVGDSLYDYLASNALKIKYLHANWGYDKKLFKKKNFAKIYNFRDISKILNT